MCAIAGILNLAEAPAPTEGALRQMLAMVRHRGPDQFGIYLDDGVGLGNARLSIIGISTGQQPISNGDGSLWIVLNGEIFNYLELRADLESKGHSFTTDCDTEVVLHAYQEYGPECLTQLNGQFAFAIWNENDRSLFLARDRVGKRPLFYTENGGRLIFASEIKSILAAPEVSAEIDPVAIEQTFTYWSAISPRTSFKGIKDVPPGYYLVARNGSIALTSYWEVRFENEVDSMLSQSGSKPLSDDSLARYKNEFHELLKDAVNIRLRADVPVGAYLSGGLDSSTIAAIVRKLGVSKLDTFSIAFHDQKFDESEFQLEMAAYLGTDHHVVKASHADIGNAFPEVIWYTETPLTRTSPVPMFLLSRLVHNQGFKVVLTGEGADEFLGGYDIFKEAKIRRFWAKNPNSKWRHLLLKRLYPDIANLGNAGSAYLAAFFGAGMKETDSPDYSHAIRWRNDRRNHRFFSKDLSAQITEQRKAGGVEHEYPEDFERWGDLEKAQYLEINIFLSQYLLSSQGDRVAMGNSVEGRCPFLDVRVMEFANRLPSRLKMRGLIDKYILRQVASEYLPEEIWKRRKRPYRAPIHRSFFNEQTPAYVRELLSDSFVATSGIFNPIAVRQLVSKLEQGKAVGETDDMALVGILSTLLVQERFVKNFQPANPLGGNDDVKVINRCKRFKPSQSLSKVC